MLAMDVIGSAVTPDVEETLRKKWPLLDKIILVPTRAD